MFMSTWAYSTLQKKKKTFERAFTWCRGQRAGALAPLGAPVHATEPSSGHVLYALYNVSTNVYQMIAK